MYDAIIIGAGPAGLSAGLYAARANMKTLILDKSGPGGQMAITNEVDNFPGSIEHASGQALAARMLKQAESFGAEVKYDGVLQVELDGTQKTIKTNTNSFTAKAVIIATGGRPRLIGCPGEKQLTGSGVSYCATCDGPFFKDLDVFVIGGGDAAVEEAIYLTRFAKKVYLVHRRNELRAAKSIVERARENEKITFIWNSVVEEIKGKFSVEAVVLRDTVTNELREMKADSLDGFGVFPFIGFEPISELFAGMLEMESGYIKTDENMKTNIQGVFAAGDVRVKSLRQVVTAASDGAIAAVMAEKYIEENKL